MGQTVKGPPWLFCQGQQSGASLEHPSQGNSMIPPLPRVTEAIWGMVQVPSKSIPPVNRAVGAPVVVVYNPSTVVNVDATVPDIIVMKTPRPVVTVDMVVAEDWEDMPVMVELDPDELLVENAHPIKSGIVTLTLLQSCTSNARASGSVLDHGTNSRQRLKTHVVGHLYCMTGRDNRKLRQYS